MSLKTLHYKYKQGSPTSTTKSPTTSTGFTGKLPLLVLVKPVNLHVAPAVLAISSAHSSADTSTNTATHKHQQNTDEAEWHELYFTLLYSTLLYSTLLYSTLFYFTR